MNGGRRPIVMPMMMHLAQYFLAQAFDGIEFVFDASNPVEKFLFFVSL
jgi:hypothetical protein